MNRILTFSLILLCTVFRAFAIDIKLDDIGVFKGDSIILSGKPYYFGTIYQNNLSETTGLFDSSFNILKATTVAPGGGRIFSDSITTCRPTRFSKIFIPGEAYIEMFGKSIIRQYDFEKGYWISNEMAFNDKTSKEKSFVYDTQDRIMFQLTKWFMYLGLINLFIIQSIKILFPKYQIKPLITCIVLSSLILLFIFLDNKFIEWTLLTPLCLWGVLVGISRLAIGKTRRILTVASIVLPILLVLYQFTITSATIQMPDGRNLPIKWRRGTDIFKRMVARNYISKMLTIDHSGEYLCKNELTEYEYSILSGEFMSWETILQPNAVKANISYDETQLLIRELNDIVGYNYFSIPTAYEWSKSTNKNDKPTKNVMEEDPHGINRGLSSVNGFIDLNGNLKELTSTYSVVPYTNINNLPFKIPDYIVIKGSSFADSICSFGNTIIPKNFAATNLGTRLSMDIKFSSKNSKVYGILLDTTNAKIPHKIELLKINGCDIKGTWDNIERQLIELSAYKREYTVKTTSGQIKEITISKNTEPYIFTPETIK